MKDFVWFDRCIDELISDRFFFYLAKKTNSIAVVDNNVLLDMDQAIVFEWDVCEQSCAVCTYIYIYIEENVVDVI